MMTKNTLRHKTSLMLILMFPFLLWAADSPRIISAGGSMTEVLYALNLDAHIVAVDSSSYFPTAAQQKPQVGYFRSLAAEGVLSMRPTLVVGTDGTGPAETLEHIKASGVTVKLFQKQVYSLDAWQQYILQVGAYFNKQSQAQVIVDRVTEKIKQISVDKRTKPKALFLMSAGDRGPVAAGKETVPDMLFELAGIENVVTELDGFKPLSSEFLIQAEPDFIVMPDHVAERYGGAQGICQLPLVKIATAKQGCRVLIMDALLALGYGTRIDQAVEQLATYAY